MTETPEKGSSPPAGLLLLGSELGLRVPWRRDGGGRLLAALAAARGEPFEHRGQTGLVWIVETPFIGPNFELEIEGTHCDQRSSKAYAAAAVRRRLRRTAQDWPRRRGPRRHGCRCERPGVRTNLHLTLQKRPYPSSASRRDRPAVGSAGLVRDGHMGCLHTGE